MLKVRFCLVGTVTLLLQGACGGGNASPVTPTPTTPTRVIALSGNLDFGNIQIGQKVSSVLEIANTGNSILTVTGFSSTGATASVFTADWVSGRSIAATLTSLPIAKE